MTTRKPYLCWHHYHNGLVFMVTETVEERIKFIRKYKPKKELATRERLIKKVRGKLPPALLRAGTGLLAARDKAFAAWVEAAIAWSNAYEHYMPAILALHAVECPDCPWDGKTIFRETKP